MTKRTNTGYDLVSSQHLYDIDCLLDCHTHMLPKMDDGAKTIEISEELINHSLEKNINYICLTPHFYPNEMKIDDFLEKRKKCYESVKDHKHTCLGAEVAYFSGIGNSKEMEKLTIGNSKYLLVEMPFEKWTNTMFNEILDLIRKGFIPIIAHFERYLKYKNLKFIKLLSNSGCLIQSNSEFFIDKKTTKKAIKFFNSGLIDLLASDAHNLETRKQTLPEALIILIQKAREIDIYGLINRYESLAESMFIKEN